MMSENSNAVLNKTLVVITLVCYSIFIMLIVEKGSDVVSFHFSVNLGHFYCAAEG